MEGQSVRSRTTSHSPSPSSYSASASVSSSLHNKRKLDEHLPSNFPYSYSDTTKDDELESMSARRGGCGDSEFENDSEDVVVEDDDDPDADIGDEEEEEDNDDSMRVFTNARLENSSRKTKIKLENSLLKIDSDIQKLTASNALAPVVGSGTGVKEILTENLQASGAYSAREESLKREEETGRLKFVCYANDGVDQHMIWLIGLKNIFARQLPNMPKEYIVRLVMDRSHKSVMVIRHNHVVGGITFRPYVSQKFGEIAFLAITADEQVKGYGTRLMNHLKQHARDVDGLTHFLTYADNNAVGYFIKQGFTKEINLDKDRWQGYIKEYDGGILMECRIDPKLPYTDLSTMIRQQRQAIDEKIRELSNCHIVYPGIDFQKKEAGIPKKIIKVEDIPGLREAGWTPDQWGHSRYKTLNSSADSTDFRQSLITFMRTLLKMMHDHPDAWPFKEPVDPRDVPDYYDVIKDPMDLRTMSKRLESGQYYLTLEMFIADVKRMCANARTYNSPETIYYKCATRLENFFNMKIQAGLQACSKVQQ